MAQGVPSRTDLIGLLREMQSGVNPRKACRIFFCNIVYVMFHIIYNSIINHTKKKLGMLKRVWYWKRNGERYCTSTQPMVATDSKS